MADVYKFSHAKVTNPAGEEIILGYEDYLEQYYLLADQVGHTYLHMQNDVTENYFYPYLQETQSYDNCLEKAKEQLKIYISE